MKYHSIHPNSIRLSVRVKFLHFLQEFLLIAGLLALPFGRVWADWNSFIVNFNKSLFGRGAQTWQIAPYDERWTYFANKSGMVQFDGERWSVFPLLGGQDVRSVLPSAKSGRIYVGGINEFGYYEPGTSGELVYHCLSDTLDSALRYVGNVWGIHEADNVLYIQGDDRVVKCVDGTCTLVQEEGMKIDCSCVARDVLYVGTNQGVWVVVGSTFFRLQGAEVLQSERIRSIRPYREGVLVATAYHGLYYCDGRTTEPLLTGAEDFMRSNEVFCMAVQGDKIALGTIHRGIVLIDLGSHRLKFFHEGNGLSDNTVLSLSFDATGQLWAGLDSGIDYVWLTLPFTNLYTRPHSCGAGYAAAARGDLLYLGTNRGLYTTTSPTVPDSGQGEIRPIEGCSGQVWDLCTLGDELFCLHDRGIFLLQGTKATRVTDITGAWTCQAVMGHTDLMYVGVYNGLYLLRRQADGRWQSVCKVDGVTDSFRQFEQESDTVLWLYNTDHVTRFTLSPDLRQVLAVREYYQADGFPCDRRMHVVKVKGRVYFSTPKGFYRLDSQADTMVPCPEMTDLLDGASGYLRVLEYGERLFALGPHELCAIDLDADASSATRTVAPLRRSLMEPVSGFETLIALSDSLLVIPHEEGFALFRMPMGHERPGVAGALHIRSIHLSYPKDSLVYSDNFLGKRPQPVISHAHNSVRMEYALPFSKATSDIRFCYRLNEEKWSDPTSVQTKEYSDLDEGEYRFEVKAVFPDGSESMDAVSFRVLPPWYRSHAAYACYVLLALWALWMVLRLEKMRVNRAKQQAEAAKGLELKRMEREYEQEKEQQAQQIMQLEKEKLEHDLQHKSQELLNLMLNLTRKNEVLAEIKTDILRVSASLRGESARDSKRQLLLINSKIDSNMQSDEVLKRIEEQFDLIHNNFMKRLQERHPDLSNSERLMCAYLKMNLSTKEIAPLLNISVRGVETMRYRLRKKFGLERKDSLTEYLAF